MAAYLSGESGFLCTIVYVAHVCTARQVSWVPLPQPRVVIPTCLCLFTHGGYITHSGQRHNPNQIVCVQKLVACNV